MAMSSSSLPMMIEDSSLEDWKLIGSGGFGQVYKARHCEWGCDVAIKVLRSDNGNESLQHEIEMMRRASNPQVIQVRGVYKGRPLSARETQLGMVMEFMERGSLASLQETLHGAPPWPLVFRLAHQVALGINFLHTLSPPLLHLDLKPSNVLLDLDLNAKLTDFGLSRVYHSVSRASKKDSGEGGTISYMPPEAFTVKYRPSLASDIYSYGILLWTIVSGEHPYPHARPTLVKFRIPDGDRPSLDEIREKAPGIAGLAGLMDLMEKCWHQTPKQRPSARECVKVTEELYKIHKRAINDAVHEVQKRLDEKEGGGVVEQLARIQITQTSVSEDVRDNVPTGRPPIQEMAGANQREVKGRVKDLHSSRPVSARNGDVSRPSMDYKMAKSSVRPIQSSPSSPSTERSHLRRAPKNIKQAFMEKESSQFKRQLSSPNTPTFSDHPAHRPQIHLCNVTGFQHGNNNHMTIQYFDPSDRRRHPTAPSRVNLPPPQPGNRKDKSAGVD